MKQQPLLGRKILVTRAPSQAKELSDAIRELGGEPIELAVIGIRQPSEPEAVKRLDDAIHHLSDYQWLFFTSVNGVEFFIRRLRELHMDLNRLKKMKIAAVGPKTAEVIQHYGLTVELVPQEFVSEGFVAAMQPNIHQGDKALLPTADIARTIIAEQLTVLGMEITQVIVYENVPNYENGQAIIDLLQTKAIDFVTFTSSSTVRNFIAAIRHNGVEEPMQLLQDVQITCIGSKTADTARELGLHVSAVAKEFTIPGLVQNLVELAQPW
ncbi:uroporphyrinogen-III synthase [Paenibacillus albiflavus]|uniref:Uroporphyrinogen-III synthase n=1 Tax=Paenibacillus albiflavus TaxID=2545760 RepID=A0A4R4EBC0_9BACL|nr:uroporphyrinogen-III synthase [Paenibacillus albiflavus]TCZ75175.1 uroporphyrinogen-III synthase [Paenibacillus albiflavus]